MQFTTRPTLQGTFGMDARRWPYPTSEPSAGERYCSGQASALVERLESSSDIRATLREALLAMAEADLADPERGCLLVNAATARSVHEATVERVKSTMAAVEPASTGALERAQARGEPDPGQSPAELARFLTTAPATPRDARSGIAPHAVRVPFPTACLTASRRAGSRPTRRSGRGSTAP